MSDLSQFVLNRRGRVRPYECVMLAHPNFTQTYYIVRNKVGGVTITIDGIPRVFQFYPLRLTEQDDRANLDYGMQVDLGDVGKIVPGEIAAIEAADGWDICPTVTYWLFRADDLSAPIIGPLNLEVTSFPMTRTGTSFVAQAPSMNVNRTGELYLPSRFPMLRGIR
ncbi:MAG: hypothetical protein WDM91_10865 [Rhizomicrobium sp.]